MADRRLPEAVLFDAYGTLIELDDPVATLSAGLAAAGFPNPPGAVEEAFRAEVRHYRAHQDLGRDPTSLAELREECAAVLVSGLPSPPPPARGAALLAAALRYRRFPDVDGALDALRREGIRLGVVSNWDCSLPEVLGEVGIADRFEVIAPSATAGARKPDPAHFRAALDALGVAPARAVHVGDHPLDDCLGASRAGMRGILLDRRGSRAGAGCARISSLDELLRELQAAGADRSPPDASSGGRDPAAEP